MSLKMKKMIQSILAILLIMLSLYAIIYSLQIIRLHKAQEKLAREFGVDINNFPFPKAFPGGYFESALEPGMSKTEVHEIVLGFELVFSCSSNDELYYYFSKDENKALKFEVLYDEADNYYMIRDVSKNASASLFVQQCK